MEKKGEEEVAGSSSGNNAVFEERERPSEADSDDEADDDHVHDTTLPNFEPGPLLPLKQQIDKDKEDDSLRRWKEKLLGCVDGDIDYGQMEPEVRFHSIGIIFDDSRETNTPLPLNGNHDGSHLLFTLKEGSQYRLKLTFSVHHNIVSGLAYTNTVWKKGVQVDQSKGMLGTFAPQRESYVHVFDEETTPSGVLARGIYSALLKFEDDDRRCHMELRYSFEIKKRSS